MPHHPANIRSRPIHITRPGGVDIWHRPRQRNSMAAIVTNNTLRLACRAGCVQDIQRVCRLDRDRRQFRHVFVRRMPFKIATRHQFSLQRFTLINDTVIRLVRGNFNRLIKQWFVGDNPAGLMTARRTDNRFRLGIVDTRGKLGRGKSAKDNRMHSAKPRTAQHGNNRFNDHRHIDDHPVALFDTQRLQHSGKAGSCSLQRAICHFRCVAGDRRIIDDRHLIAMPGLYMPVHRVITGVQRAIRKPAVEGRVGIIQRRLRRSHPVNALGSFQPEAGCITLRAFIDILIRSHGAALQSG